MATKFTYKMRSGGKWDVGSGTARCLCCKTVGPGPRFSPNDIVPSASYSLKFGLRIFAGKAFRQYKKKI